MVHVIYSTDVSSAPLGLPSGALCESSKPPILVLDVATLAKIDRKTTRRLSEFEAKGEEESGKDEGKEDGQDKDLGDEDSVERRSILR